MKRILSLLLPPRSCVMLAVLSLASAAGHAGAEPPAPSVVASAEDGLRLRGQLSLEDAIKTALLHNRALQAAVEQRAVARGRVMEAWGEALPKVTADSTYAHADDVTAFDFGGTRIAMGKLDTYSAGLTIEQPLIHGRSTFAALRAARLYRAFTDEAVRGTVQRTVYQAAGDYYRVVLLTQQLEVARTYLTLTEAHLKDVEVKKRFGVASHFNVLRAQVERSNARVAQLAVQNELDAARAALFRTLGVSQDSDATLSTGLDYAPLAADEADALRLALRERPDLAAAGKGVNLQQQALTIAASRYWPDLDATFRYGWARPDPYSPMLDQWGSAWRLSLTARWTLFDGLRREGRVAQEKATLRQRRIEHDDARERVLFEVRTAVQALANATQSVEAQKLTVEQASEGLRLAEVGYREGTLDQVGVLDTRNALTQARLFYVRSLHAHAMAKLNLWLATGTLSPRQVAAAPTTATGSAVPDAVVETTR